MSPGKPKYYITVVLRKRVLYGISAHLSQFPELPPIASRQFPQCNKFEDVVRLHDLTHTHKVATNYTAAKTTTKCLANVQCHAP